MSALVPNKLLTNTVI